MYIPEMSVIMFVSLLPHHFFTLLYRQTLYCFNLLLLFRNPFFFFKLKYSLVVLVYHKVIQWCVCVCVCVCILFNIHFYFKLLLDIEYSFLCSPAEPFCFLFYIQQFISAWRRQWHPTPVLLPGQSHGWRSLVGYSPWGREESDTTERLHFHFHQGNSFFRTSQSVRDRTGILSP